MFCHFNSEISDDTSTELVGYTNSLVRRSTAISYLIFFSFIATFSFSIDWILDCASRASLFITTTNSFAFAVDFARSYRSLAISYSRSGICVSSI